MLKNMKRFAAVLCFSFGSLVTGPAPVLADERLDALSAEIEAVKASQATIQEQLHNLMQWLARAPEAAVGSAAEVADPADDTATEALQKELEELRKVVVGYKKREEQARKARQPVRNAKVSLKVGNDPFRGSKDARIALVEFTDYQCPYCSRHNKQVTPKLLENFVETGKVRYVIRDFPLGFHKQAAKAHESAHCAGEQDKYWEMNEQLFANQRALQLEKLPGYAEAAGVADLEAFQKCLDSGRYAERGRLSREEGTKAGIRGTPSFLLGVIGADGTTVEATKFIRGAQKYKVFADTIEELLSEAAK